jgi:hydroxyacylglutathione hydrolase
MKLLALPAFSDNYIWLLHDKGRAVVIDPGQAQPVLDALAREQLQLEAILVTHHHADHVGGVQVLREQTGASVYGPARERMPEPLTRLQGGDRVQALGLDFLVMDVPGHTAGHVAYFCPAPPGLDPILFCGDTLFSGGCGRLFEGTPEQMLASLDALAALPAATQVCCAHEYTLSNLKFARAVEPGNADLIHYTALCEDKRRKNLPTLPSHISLELQINPFLRTRHTDVIAAAERFDPSARGPSGHLAALRQWKNQF